MPLVIKPHRESELFRRGRDCLRPSFAFLPAKGIPARPLKGIVYVVAPDGNQAFAFDFESQEDT